MELTWSTSVPFQSTLPVRGATISVDKSRLRGRFQSTLPVRGATASLIVRGRHSRISIHAPREGSDRLFHIFDILKRYFNPRSP